MALKEKLGSFLSSWSITSFRKRRVKWTPVNPFIPRSDQHETSPHIQQTGNKNIQTDQVEVVILI